LGRSCLSNNSVIIFQEADKPRPHARMREWSFGINLPLVVDKCVLFLFAGGGGLSNQRIEKLERINANVELTADVDVLVTEVHNRLTRQLMGKGSSVHLKKARVGGKEQVS